MNERTTRTNEPNGRYFSEETAERLPLEGRRRQLLVAETERLKSLIAEKQQEMDGYLSHEMSDGEMTIVIDLMDDIDSLKSSLFWTRKDIERLDGGETLADIYGNIFG